MFFFFLFPQNPEKTVKIFALSYFTFFSYPILLVSSGRKEILVPRIKGCCGLLQKLLMLMLSAVQHPVTHI